MRPGLGLALAAVLVSAGCGSQHRAVGAGAMPARAVVTIRTVEVGDPGNTPVAIVPFHPGIYENCGSAPSRHSGCRVVGRVGYAYGIGEVEVTVRQYVAFLNTVDPFGSNRRDLYIELMSPSRWPKYGSIRRLTGPSLKSGRHYAVAYPEWADKPVGFANFLRAASFANALTNGDVLSRTTANENGAHVTTTTVRLSRNIDAGMYDLRTKPSTRTRSSGFVVPSQDEWIKAAYYDPDGGGTFSYWQFPTGPTKAPQASELGTNGDVVNADTQPQSTFSPRGATSVPTWCPAQAGESCDTTNPFGLSAQEYQSKYRANLSTVGQTATRSPWGTLDQGGNVVEWTDTVAPSLRANDRRVWRFAHGGVANAPAYQLWISAVGRLPEANVATARVNPWEGFRIGVIGDVRQLSS